MKVIRTDKWWSDEVYEYGTLQTLTDEIMEIKQDRQRDKKLSDESYDFVIFFNQVI